MPSHDEIKRYVKKCKAYADSKGHDIKLAFFYECAAMLYGYNNWDTFSGILKKNDLAIQEWADQQINEKVIGVF